MACGPSKVMKNASVQQHSLWNQLLIERGQLLMEKASRSFDTSPFLQQPPFPYNYPLLFVIPSAAEGPAVRHSCAPPLPAHNLHQIIHRILMEIPTSPLSSRKMTRPPPAP